MKKLISSFMSIMLAAVFVMQVCCLQVFADTPKGTVNVNSAEQGYTYSLVKVFDVQTNVISDESGTTTNISYSLTKSENEGLYNLIKNNTDLTKADGTVVKCPFVLHSTDNANIFNVVHKTPEAGQSAEFGRGWLYGWYGVEGGWNLSPLKTATLESGNTVSFTDVPYAYYMITKTNGDKKANIASVVTLSSDSASIWDKNPRSPGDPEKKVQTGTKWEDTKEVQVGDVVKYQASFMATNYRTYDNMTSRQIKAYSFRDDAKGLKYKSLDSMTIYKTKNADGTFSDQIARTEWPDAEGHLAPYVADATFGGYSMTIPWVNEETGEPLYPATCYVVLEYQMYVTEAALNNSYNNTATNTFSPSFIIDSDPIPMDNPPSVKVLTTGLSITKTDKSGHPLENSKFILSKVDASGNETYYSRVDEESSLTHEKWKNVEWVARENAELVTATNSPDAQTFGGLTSGTYRLYEIETPDGFRFPDFEYWEIVISYDKTKANPFSATIRPANADMEDVTDLPLYTSGTVTRNYFATTIQNEGGVALPNTGAAGTTMLLLIGGALFAGTMLILVTKKRLYNLG